MSINSILCKCIKKQFLSNTLFRGDFMKDDMDRTLQKDLKKLKSNDTNTRLKYEVANEIGLLDKVLTDGWKSLTAKETGRIGGIIKSKKDKENGHEK